MQVLLDQCVMHTAETHETQSNLINTTLDSAFHSTTYGINFNSPLNNLNPADISTLTEKVIDALIKK